MNNPQTNNIDIFGLINNCLISICTGFVAGVVAMCVYFGIIYITKIEGLNFIQTLILMFSTFIGTLTYCAVSKLFKKIVNKQDNSGEFLHNLIANIFIVFICFFALITLLTQTINAPYYVLIAQLVSGFLIYSISRNDNKNSLIGSVLGLNFGVFALLFLILFIDKFNENFSIIVSFLGYIIIGFCVSLGQILTEISVNIVTNSDQE